MDFKTIFDQIQTGVLPLFSSFRSELKDLTIEIKDDNTLLTQADVVIQEAIIQLIRSHDERAQFIGEEEYGNMVDSRRGIWVIDPIDGTREFVNPDGREFCCAISYLESRRSVAALIIAPELSYEPVCIQVVPNGLGEVTVNGQIFQPGIRQDLEPSLFSLTRSRGTTVPRYENLVRSRGINVKTRTTSQTIDLLRTALDLNVIIDPPLDKMDLFFRPRQKLWDGAPGICVNVAVGNIAVDLSGQSILPFDREIIEHEEPIIPETLVASEAIARWFLESLK